MNASAMDDQAFSSKFEFLAGVLLDSFAIDEIGRDNVFDGQAERLENRNVVWRSSSFDFSREHLSEFADDVGGGELALLDAHHDVTRFDERGRTRVDEQASATDERRIHFTLIRPAGADADHVG